MAWEAVKERGYEGLVAKDERSRYEAGESRSWIKVKVRHEREFVVGGIGTARDGTPRLLVGEQVNGDLVYRGTVELGVGPDLVTELMTRGRRLDTSPFAGHWDPRGVVWLDPITKVEVTYGRVAQGWLREPACRGLAENSQG